jgi:hypothetical protein
VQYPDTDGRIWIIQSHTNELIFLETEDDRQVSSFSIALDLLDGAVEYPGVAGAQCAFAGSGQGGWETVGDDGRDLVRGKGS